MALAVDTATAAATSTIATTGLPPSQWPFQPSPPILPPLAPALPNHPQSLLEVLARQWRTASVHD